MRRSRSWELPRPCGVGGESRAVPSRVWPEGQWQADGSAGVRGYPQRSRNGKDPFHKAGKPLSKPVNLKHQVLPYIQGNWRSSVRKLTLTAIIRHLVEDDTTYFTANSLGDETILMIDIDCHACGTLKGATQFAEFLKRRYFPNLYIETSTHGNGAHGSQAAHSHPAEGRVADGEVQHGDCRCGVRGAVRGRGIGTGAVSRSRPIYLWCPSTISQPR